MQAVRKLTEVAEMKKKKKGRQATRREATSRVKMAVSCHPQRPKLKPFWCPVVS
jgi:hypothetical protein